MDGGEQTFETKLREIAAGTGSRGRYEIFPKARSKYLVERGDVGNFINLPYFDAAKDPQVRGHSERKMAKYVEATLEQFVLIEIHKSKHVLPKTIYGDISMAGRQTCFQDLCHVSVLCYLSVGVHEGGRNRAAFQLRCFFTEVSHLTTGRRR